MSDESVLAVSTDIYMRQRAAAAKFGKVLARSQYKSTLNNIGEFGKPHTLRKYRICHDGNEKIGTMVKY